MVMPAPDRQPLRIIIIGAEAAGMSAAAMARKVDPEATITVFEQSDIISFGAYALPYFIGDFFSCAADMSEIRPQEFSSRNIDVHPCHRVKTIDPDQRTVTVENLAIGKTFTQSYDRLLIATGATPVLPLVPGMQENIQTGRVSCVKTLQDGINLKEAVSSDLIQEVTIIGASYIGLEMAEALERQGKRVRIFESEPQPLAHSFDSEVAELVTETLEARNVTTHWQESLSSLSISDSGHLILQTMNKDGKPSRYFADLIVLCTGVRPATDFTDGLALKKLHNGAIITDDQGRSSIKTIFAAGDCATIYHGQLQKPVWIPLATYANKMGRLAGEVMAGRDTRFPGAYGASCLKVMDLEAGRVGLSEREAVRHGIDYKTVVISDKDHASYYPGQSDIMIKLVYEPGTRKLLGGQIAGERGAVLRVNTLAAAIRGGLTTEDLSMLDLCYSPPFSRTWDALSVAGDAAK